MTSSGKVPPPSAASVSELPCIKVINLLFTDFGPSIVMPKDLKLYVDEVQKRVQVIEAIMTDCLQQPEPGAQYNR